MDLADEEGAFGPENLRREVGEPTRHRMDAVSQEGCERRGIPFAQPPGGVHLEHFTELLMTTDRSPCVRERATGIDPGEWRVSGNP